MNIRLQQPVFCKRASAMREYETASWRVSCANACLQCVNIRLLYESEHLFANACLLLQCEYSGKCMNKSNFDTVNSLGCSWDQRQWAIFWLWKASKHVCEPACFCVSLLYKQTCTLQSGLDCWLYDHLCLWAHCDTDVCACMPQLFMVERVQIRSAMHTAAEGVG